MNTKLSLYFGSFIPAIAWFVIVLILICLPGDDLPQPDNWMSLIYFDKWVHTGLFAILTFLCMRPVLLTRKTPAEKKNLLIKILIAISLWGFTTELIQLYFITGRNFDLFDWLFDSAGALISYAVCRYWYFSKKQAGENVL